jgi:hypothetical protein
VHLVNDSLRRVEAQSKRHTHVTCILAICIKAMNVTLRYSHVHDWLLVNNMCKTRSHHTHECDAYTYLEVLDAVPEEIHLRKQG